MPNNIPVQILIVDDHQIFIDGIVSLFQDEKKYNISGQAKNKKELISCLRQSVPDIVLLDLNLGNADGLTLINVIKQHSPPPKIIVITMYNEQQLIQKAFKEGVEGYILKSAGKEELTIAIDNVINGSFYKSEALVKNLAYEENEFEDKTTYPDDFLKKYNLTPRETDVLILMAKSFSTRDIAEKLCISEMTVSTHRKKIKIKLGIKNLAGIVKFAFENQLL